MLQRDGTPKSSQAVELQETDALILNGKALTPVSYTNVSSSFSSLSSLKLNNNELSIILIGAAAGNFLGNTTLHLLQVYVLYAAVFFMRPVGGIIFGIIGDRYGRLQSLKISIILMGASTLITALLPTYEMIGIWSTILMVTVRLLQGLSVGGELSGAMIYTVEICPQNHRALFAIFVQVTGFGTLLASGIMAILYAVFTMETILAWAWRLPFVFGCFIGIFGIWARVYLTQESREFLRAKRHGDLVENPVKYAFQNCKWRMLSMMLHIAFVIYAYYIYFVWLPTYFTVISQYTFNVFAVNTVGMIICATSAIISSHWIDKYKRLTSSKSILCFGSIHMTLASILFGYLNNPSDSSLAIIIWLLLALSFGLYYGPGAGIWLINIFPDVSCRYSAFGISYNLSAATFGGSASLIATYLQSNWGGISSIGWSLFILGVISLTSDAFSWYFHRKSTWKYDL